jgi:VanZ family protein
MMINNKKIIILAVSWLSVLIWMGIIFSLSSQPGDESSKFSLGVTEYVIKVVNTIAPTLNIDKNDFHIFIRKNGHFFVYLLLGMLVINAMYRSGLVGNKLIVSSVLFCLLFALSDEIHQLYVPGRGSSLYDVLIDSIGALIGIYIYCKVTRLHRVKNLLNRPI